MSRKIQIKCTQQYNLAIYAEFALEFMLNAHDKRFIICHFLRSVFYMNSSRCAAIFSVVIEIHSSGMTHLSTRTCLCFHIFFLSQSQQRMYKYQLKENLNSLMNQNNDFKFFNIFSPSSSSNLLAQTFASCLRKPIASQNNRSLFVQFTTEILSIFSKLFFNYFQSSNEVRNSENPIINKIQLLIKKADFFS